ncbi:MAG: hypothetical protein K9K37_00360 [Desulfocapsa sp.]|nr:hypothetical protein [Desulfocapsa sp.]
MSNLLHDNLTYVGLMGVVVLLLLLALISQSVRDQFRKGVIPILILTGLGLGYYLITGKSPSQIPGDINRFFSDPHISEEASHRYYKDPEERYGEQIK